MGGDVDAPVDDVGELEILVFLGEHGPVVALGTRRYTTPTVSLSLTLSARAAPSGTKPSSATARSTRSRVSARGLPVPLRTRETDAMDTPAVAATS